MIHRILLLIFLLSAPLYAQPTPNPTAFGISIDPNGSLQHRAKDAQADLARLRSLRSSKTPGLLYLSLPKLLSDAKACLDNHQPLPPDLQYLHGLTQIRYIFLYPDDHDLVLAGPAEPIDAANPLMPLGKLTGRPILQFDDLIVALRLSHERRPQPFGCSIDPAPNAVEKGQKVANEYMNRPRSELTAALAKALGPQPVRIFGVADNTRFGFVCVAADYQLKRYFLGLDPPPVTGLGNPVDNSRAAGNAYWFEMLYDPILVSKDNDAFELRGPRLQLKTGQLPFEEKGATERAKAWAKTFSTKIPQIATAMPLFADLQNLADLSLATQLIRHDHLDERANLNIDWLIDPAQYHPATIPTAKSVDTLVNITNGSVTAGGVLLSAVHWLESRQTDDTHTLDAPKRQRPKD
jgi:hypothetical protein